jgi:excisionase family DNA binding protein
VLEIKRGFSQAEAASYCGLKIETFRKVAKQHEIPAVKPTRNPVYLREDLDRFLDNLPTE